MRGTDGFKQRIGLELCQPGGGYFLFHQQSGSCCDSAGPRLDDFPGASDCRHLRSVARRAIELPLVNGEPIPLRRRRHHAHALPNAPLTQPRVMRNRVAVSASLKLRARAWRPRSIGEARAHVIQTLETQRNSSWYSQHGAAAERNKVLLRVARQREVVRILRATWQRSAAFQRSAKLYGVVGSCQRIRRAAARDHITYHRIS